MIRENHGDEIRVVITVADMLDFRDRWPASGLPAAEVTLIFNKQGDLVRSVPTDFPGTEAAQALIRQAWAFKGGP